MALSVTLLAVGIVLAVLESLVGFSAILTPLAGFILLFGLVVFVYYTGLLVHGGSQASKTDNSIW